MAWTQDGVIRAGENSTCPQQAKTELGIKVLPHFDRAAQGSIGWDKFIAGVGAGGRVETNFESSHRYSLSPQRGQRLHREEATRYVNRYAGRVVPEAGSGDAFPGMSHPSQSS